MFLGSAYEINSKSGVSKMLIFSGSLLLSVWCLRYAVGYFEILSLESPAEGLTWYEEIFNSLVHSLQTFSMDEDYTEYIINGKKMLGALSFNELGNFDLPFWYGIYASLLNIVAPIAGGALIFEILASIFPKIKLGFSRIAFWKEKYYFSELNEASLALAKSVLKSNHGFFTRPTIVFTDAYFDDEDERSTEKMIQAKSLGTICVRDDLAHVKKNRFGKRKFFLIDQNKTSNLQTLTELATKYNSRYLKNSEIYLFINDDAYVQVEKNVISRLKRLWEIPEKENNIPITIIPVQTYRNLISNLLSEVPLYETLINKKEKSDGTKDLTVTILGAGNIGTEMFLSTYWFGQILNCNLRINVVSKEEEQEFRSKVDYINPEILCSMNKEDSCLDINNKEQKSPIYAEKHYYPYDAKSSKFIEKLQNNEDELLDTDYFFVALGSDEDNISVANTLKRYIGEHHIKKSKEKKKTIISYVVYNSELVETLNTIKRYKFYSSDSKIDSEFDVYMKAVGALDELYEMKNLLMTEYLLQAKTCGESHKAHSSSYDANNVLTKNKNRSSSAKSEYNYWADISRVLHKKYKAFSAGLIDKSIFDFSNDEEYDTKKSEILKEYRKFVVESRNISSNLKLLNDLSWLEHRRWNAFTRVKGYKSTDLYPDYRDLTGTHQHWEIKLHPCLVECDKNGMRPVFKPDNIIWNEYYNCDKSCETCGKCKERSKKLGNDYLDAVSELIGKCDYKEYDYPFEDFPDLSVKDVVDEYNIKKKKAEKLFQNEVKGVYKDKYGEIRAPQTEFNISVFEKSK